MRSRSSRRSMFSSDQRRSRSRLFRPLAVEFLEDRTLLSASFFVNDNADTVDAKPGDGFALDANGNTTLRAAVMEANALAGHDSIFIPAGTFTLVIQGKLEDAAETGDLDVTDTLTITGVAAGTTIINTNGADRLLDVQSGALLNLSHVTLTGGNGNDFGGAIRNSASVLNISHTDIIGNRADIGGGIYADGLFNTSATGHVTITDSRIINNLAGDSGGIHNRSGSLTVLRTTISGNTAFRDGGGATGGGVGNNGNFSTTTMTIADTTISGNTADIGGGLHLNNSAATLVDTTISGNIGNGVSNVNGAVSTLSNVTVTANTATGTAGIVNESLLRLANTIVAGNVGNSDVEGAFTSAGNNLIGKVGSGITVSGLSDGVNSDQVGTAASPIDPLLGPLEDNGGPTLTHQLQEGSPALDMGSNGQAPISGDQIIDGSGNGIHGILNGNAAVIEGKNNDGIEFFSKSGSTAGNYIDLGGENIPTALRPTDKLTIAAWVNVPLLTTDHTDRHEIFNMQRPGGAFQFTAHAEVLNDGQIRLLLRDSQLQTIVDLRGETVPYGEWFHYAATFDRAANTATLYINGTEVESTELAIDAAIGSDEIHAARVGSMTRNIRQFDGGMDEFYLFTRSLDATEVQDLAATPTTPTSGPRVTGDLSIYYSFDDLAANRTDQRGESRIEDGTAGGVATVDVGSVEAPAAPPQINVFGVEQLEGDSGETVFEFEVRLSAAVNVPVEFDYTTDDHTALAGVDYDDESGHVTFAPGETSQIIPVTVFGDTTPESHLEFFLGLSNITGIDAGNITAVGRILDDDGVLHVTDDEYTVALNETLHAGLINGHFETGDLTGWQTFTTPGGTLGNGFPDVVRFDVDGDGVETEAVQLLVGNGGGGISQSVDVLGGTVIVSAQVATDALLADNEGGLFELLFDGDVVASQDFGAIAAEETMRTVLSAELSSILAGTHEVAVRVTRAGNSSFGSSPFAFIDNITVATAAEGVLGNDYDGELPAPVSSIVVAGPQYGRLQLMPDGSFSYTPDQDFYGTDTFSYKAVAEGDGLSLFTIDVVNDKLLKLNLADGEITNIGSIGHDMLSSDLTYMNGVLYATNVNSSAGLYELVSIDPLTGAKIASTAITTNATILSIKGITAVDDTLYVNYARPLAVCGNACGAFTIGSVDPTDGVITGLVNYRGFTGTNFDWHALITEANGDIVGLRHNQGSVQVQHLGIDPASLTDLGQSWPPIGASLNDATAAGGFTYLFNAGTETLHRYDPLGAGYDVILENIPVGPLSDNLSGMAFAPDLELYTGTVTITVEPPPLVSIGDALEVKEGDNVVFVVGLDRAGDSPIEVTFETTDGTAIFADDYEAATDTLVFAPGETEKLITIVTIEDDVEEPTEEFYVNLVSVSGALIEDEVATGTILDDDSRIVQLQIDLYADNGGIMGELINDETLLSGQTFFAVVSAADLREVPSGLVGLSIDFDWDGDVFTEIDDPFDPTDLASPLIAPEFTLFRDGTLDQAGGLIDELSGGSLPAIGLGEAIGVGSLQTFSVMHFRADTPAENTSFVITIGDGGIGLTDGETNFTTLLDEQFVTVGAPAISVSDNSAANDDASVQFTTALSTFRPGAEDSPFVRPAAPDEQHYFEVTNSGDTTLILFEIQINAPGVTVDLPLNAAAGDDISLEAGQTQRFNLTFAPDLPNLADANHYDFAMGDGIVILSNAANDPSLKFALQGKSTFNSDISYDGVVNFGDLGGFNANFGLTPGHPDYDPTADINGGGVNFADLGPFNAEFGSDINNPPALTSSVEESTKTAVPTFFVTQQSEPALLDNNEDQATADAARLAAPLEPATEPEPDVTESANAFDAVFEELGGGQDVTDKDRLDLYQFDSTLLGAVSRNWEAVA